MGGECLDEKIKYDQAMLNRDREEKNFWEIAAKLDGAKEAYEKLEEIEEDELLWFGENREKVEAALQSTAELIAALDQEMLDETDTLEKCVANEIAAHDAYVTCCNKEKSGGPPVDDEGDDNGDEGCDDGDDNGLEEEIEEFIAKVEAEMEEILELLKQALDGIGEGEQSTANDIALIG